MTLLAIVDTNVVVSAVLTTTPGSPVVEVLDGMLTGTLRYLLSPALLSEYRTVLLRPGIARLHGLATAEPWRRWLRGAPSQYSWQTSG